MVMHVDWEQQVDWAKIREYRMSRLVEGIRAEGLDGVLLTKLDTIRYAISFRPVVSLWFHGTRYILLINADGRLKFLVASGDLERVLGTMPWLRKEDVIPFPFLISTGVHLVEQAIAELGLKGGKIGVDMLPFNLFEPLQKALPQTRFVDGLGVFDRARLIKHPEEVKVLRQAAQVADVGMQTALDALRPGVTEADVAAAAAHAMLREGAEDVTHRPLVEAGEHTWLGYRFPTDRRIQNGDMVYIDCGSALINGYAGDIARTTVVGKPTPKQAEIYKVMVEMLFAGIEQLRPGNTCSQVVRAVEAVATRAGLQEHTYFGIIGHGIGTDMHEPPIIGDKVLDHGVAEQVLQPNMVVCLEPGILLPGVGGGHVENMVLITENGPESLNKTAFDDRML